VKKAKNNELPALIEIRCGDDAAFLNRGRNRSGHAAAPAHLKSAGSRASPFRRRSSRAAATANCVFAGHLVGKVGVPKCSCTRRTTSRLGHAGLDYHHVGTLGQVPLYLAQCFVGVRRIHASGANRPLQWPTEHGVMSATPMALSGSHHKAPGFAGV
jgi:hypothetical protein